MSWSQPAHTGFMLGQLIVSLLLAAGPLGSAKEAFLIFQKDNSRMVILDTILIWVLFYSVILVKFHPLFEVSRFLTILQLIILTFAGIF